jgi:general secretion pathway protein A
VPSLQVRENIAVPPPIAAVEPPRVAVKPRSFPSPTPARVTTYETFYGLDEKPFAPEPDLRFLYHSSAHDKVIQDLATSVGKRDAVAVLTGPAGIGKTMLCRALVEQLDHRTLVSFVAEAPASPEALLGTLLVDFGVVSAEDMAAGRLAAASRSELSSALRDFLSSLAVLQASALLIVDDAHRVADAVLHELRALSDIAATGKLLQIVLAGEPSLLRQLRSAELRPIEERVAVRTELGPLEQDEVPGYVAHRLAVAGRGERVGFSEVALRRIFSVSGGVPGVINRLCDRALTLGSRISASQIDGDFVEDAAQQLGLSSSSSDRGATWRDRMAIVLVMLALMLAGAGAASWVFRAPLSRALAQWHGAGRSTSSTPR